MFILGIINKLVKVPPPLPANPYPISLVCVYGLHKSLSPEEYLISSSCIMARTCVAHLHGGYPISLPIHQPVGEVMARATLPRAVGTHRE